MRMIREDGTLRVLPGASPEGSLADGDLGAARDAGVAPAAAPAEPGLPPARAKAAAHAAPHAAAHARRPAHARAGQHAHARAKPAQAAARPPCLVRAGAATALAFSLLLCFIDRARTHIHGWPAH